RQRGGGSGGRAAAGGQGGGARGGRRGGQSEDRAAGGSPVTSTLPPEAREAFERFITCELTTVDAKKQPITWPVTPYYEQGGATIDVTTGLGYPKKADDARAHPSVALLFSDATGSGIESGARVLVQGTATVDDEDLKANAQRYMAESDVKLPATRKMHPPKP